MFLVKRIFSTIYLVFFLSLIAVSMMGLMFPARPTFHSKAHIQTTPEPSPTIDRLAAPPTVEAPGPADNGAQSYWLNCQPCHGDQGQGLTEDWRNQYPEEDRGCWNSGCHGPRPYEDGFTLPKAVPAIIGDGTLTKFASAANLYGYIAAAMPFNAPGSLSEADYLNITAFLVREHNIQTLNPQSLSVADLEGIALYLQVEPTLAITLTPGPTSTPKPADPPEKQDQNSNRLLVICFALLLATSAMIKWIRKKEPPDS